MKSNPFNLWPITMRMPCKLQHKNNMIFLCGKDVAMSMCPPRQHTWVYYRTAVFKCPFDMYVSHMVCMRWGYISPSDRQPTWDGYVRCDPACAVTSQVHSGQWQCLGSLREVIIKELKRQRFICHPRLSHDLTDDWADD